MNNKEVEQQHYEFQERFNKERLENGMPEDNFKIVAIGYLELSEPFERGEVPEGFITKLKILWGEGIMMGSLGHHDCEFCIDEDNYENRGRSSSEKTLEDVRNETTYYFPEMIFHYIEVHKFKPSEEFIEFVMRV